MRWGGRFRAAAQRFVRRARRSFSQDKELRNSKDALRISVTKIMEKNSLAIITTIAFSIVGVLGDYFLKLASENENALKTRWFYIGFGLYASTAFGWVFVMKYLKLATISVVYSISMVLLLTGVGVVFFRESLNYYEIGGLIMAIGSLILLMRFA
jgi:drug/metabolite transporter (DMT)-like permease